MNSWEIAGHTLEYFDDTHEYLVDGLLVPSITQILKYKFGNCSTSGYTLSISSTPTLANISP